jgi:polar amino acid transport system substrate-binding protein
LLTKSAQDNLKMEECNWGKIPECCDWCDRNGLVECLALKIPNIDGIIKSLESEKAEIQKLNQVKSEFLANISHEIKTPMNAILGMSYLLSKTNISPEQKSYTDKIISSAKTLLGIMNDVLDMSKIEAGQMQVTIGPVEIRKLIDEVISISRFGIEEKRLRFFATTQSEIPKYLVTDELRLKQILLNLINNAVKFTDKGEILLRAALQDNKVVFCVSDSGIGIKEEERDRIFKPFIQVDSSMRKRYQGSGLGLSICKNLVSLLNGELWFESNFQKGSEFYFSIPTEQICVGVSLAPGQIPSIRKNKYYWIEENPAIHNELSKWAINLDFNFLVCKSLTDFALHLDEEPAFLFVNRSYLISGSDNYLLIDLKKNLKLTNVKICMLTHFSERFPLDVEWVNVVDYHFTMPLQTWLIERLVKELEMGADIESLGVVNRLFNEQDQKLENVRILIVEDNVLNQMVAHDILVKMGASVTIAESGEAALSLFDQDQKIFDIVLMDIQMPLMDGYQTTRKIKTMRHSKNIPVIAMTAHSLDEENENYLVNGMVDIINKPFEPEHLVKTLLKYCRPLFEFAQKVYESPAELKMGTAIDWELAKQNMGNNDSLLKTVLGRFVRDYSLARNFLGQLYFQGDWGQLERNIYSLKSISCYIGANVLRKKLGQLEKLFKDRDKDQDQENLFKAIAAVESEITLVIAEINQYLRRLSPAINVEFI